MNRDVSRDREYAKCQFASRSMRDLRLDWSYEGPNGFVRIVVNEGSSFHKPVPLISFATVHMIVGFLARSHCFITNCWRRRKKYVYIHIYIYTHIYIYIYTYTIHICWKYTHTLLREGLSENFISAPVIAIILLYTSKVVRALGKELLLSRQHEHQSFTNESR